MTPKETTSPTPQKKPPKTKTGYPALVDRQLIRALGHPLRTHILSILNEKTASPSELSEELGQGLSQVSYHVGVLVECEFIELVDTQPRRGAVEHFYRAIRRSLVPSDAWGKLPPSTQYGITGGILQEIFDDSGQALEAGNFGRRSDSHASWTPLVLDEQGWTGLSSLLAEMLERIFDLQAESSARLVEKDEADKDEVAATVALIGFESTRSPEEAKKAHVTKR